MNCDLDNWFMIERQIAAKSNTTVGSSSVHQQKKTSSSSSEATLPSGRSSVSTLGTLLSETQRDAALLTYKKIEDEQKWKLKSGRYVEDVMQSVVMTQLYGQYVRIDLYSMTRAKFIT